MANDPTEGTADRIPVLLAWGLPGADAREDPRERLHAWVSGGAGLLAWTALALVLTA